MQGISATALYAAKAAPVLPLEVAKQNPLPCSCIRDSANAANRSLYEPEGFRFSNLKKRLSSPIVDPIFLERTNGVSPSPMESWYSLPTWGNKCLYFQIPFKIDWGIVNASSNNC